MSAVDRARHGLIFVPMRHLCFVFLLFLCSRAPAQYFPSPTEWEQRTAEEAGFTEAGLDSVVQFALRNEYSGQRDLRLAILESFSREPGHKLRGPTKDRGEPAGMIIKDGYLVTSWGYTDRVDMTFSVTKSYLSTTAGLALDDGLIHSVDDLVVGIRMGRHLRRHAQRGDHLGTPAAANLRLVGYPLRAGRLDGSARPRRHLRQLEKSGAPHSRHPLQIQRCPRKRARLLPTAGMAAARCPGS